MRSITRQDPKQIAKIRGMEHFKRYLLVIFCVFSGPLWAATSPLAVSIAPPAQFPPSDFDVTGVRVNTLYGSHRNVYGLDVGLLANAVEQKFFGIQIAGGFNYNQGRATAIGTQLAGLGNINKEQISVAGIQLGGLFNYNEAESAIYGLQVALAANLASHTDVYGAQIGLYNHADSVYGFQIGLVNRCKNLHGIQIGLVNFHHNGLFKVSPILNVGF